MSLFLIVSVPLTAALIGWITNYIAIKMLFRPRKPVRFFGLCLHGLVPRRQAQLAASIAETVETELISHDDIRRFLETEESQEAIKKLLEEQIQNFLTHKLGANPMVAMFLQGDVGNSLRQSLVSQFQDAIPALLNTLMNRLEDGLDLQKVIREKIEGFELSKLEEIIYRISAKELRTIELLGGVLGFLVGVIQLVFFHFGSN